MDEYNERYGNVYKEKAKQERSRSNIGTPTTFYNEPKKRVKIASPIDDVDEVEMFEHSKYKYIFFM